ncbi:hypothetical protein PCCS19_42550 [Paenibacillus sp. CCS19]|uniref:hypothetical protein n=1 Tax=Paenibacillus sp. CCS19 TaxID=3158387 RepID=UPI002560F362|nr:hypothetical protein [Paenibacillus cellulosilyticus]GMK41199.1 hypothetical protein PCCS19_42550 [Paenibacillus cellulosilyticus]
MNKFSTNQFNNLISGNSLACELAASSSDYRSFIVCRAVSTTMFLNTSDPEKLNFWIRKYEIPTEYLINGWDVCDDELTNSIHIKDIEGVSQLEHVLLRYISDLSPLDIDWKCDNPL